VAPPLITQALAVTKLLMVTITQEPQGGPLPPPPTVRDIVEGPINQLPPTAGLWPHTTIHVPVAVVYNEMLSSAALRSTTPYKMGVFT